MSDLSKKLRELAECELNDLVDGLVVNAGEAAPRPITGSDLLRIAAGGKTQVLRNAVIKQLVDAKAAKLLDSLDNNS